MRSIDLLEPLERRARVRASRSAAEGAKARMEEKKREVLEVDGVGGAAVGSGASLDRVGAGGGRSSDSADTRADGMKGADATERSEEGRVRVPGPKPGDEVDVWRREADVERAVEKPLKEKTLASGLSLPSFEVLEVEGPSDIDAGRSRVLGEGSVSALLAAPNHFLGVNLDVRA